MDKFALRGAKGGASSSPTQAPDTLSSVTFAQILDLISEGPIYGPPSGVPAQSVYLNDVPLQNADGSNNFDINGFDFRYGEVDQPYIAGFATSQQPFSVGVELKQVTPWNVTVTDLTTNAIVITLQVAALSNTDPNSGDVTGYEVDYQIQLSIDGGAFSPVVNSSFNGKASSSYQRSHTVPLAGATQSYQLRVVRTTADTTSVYIQDTTSVVSYTLVIDAKLSYPFSALAALSVNAVQFSSVPTRSYALRGLIISVPSNYNPTTRTYTGTWDGTFVQAWTNNPAWIFYDLVLNSRYGAGRWVTADMVDRYSLYNIAQYCDVLVSDGQGGTEPRFTCNCYITTQADCFKVLQDLASVFRGMAYWGAGAVVATADMPADPVYVYTAANVVNGQFKYAGSALKSRYTAAAVTWNDPSNNYKQAVEYVQNVAGIARYGLQEAQITAFGTTSRGQAQRAGQWTLLTSQYETNTVTFSVGLDGALCMPGQIIAIADASRAGYRMAGRLHGVTSTSVVTLDSPMTNAAVGDILTVVMPSGVSAKAPISAIDSTFQQITVSPAFTTAPVPGAVWMIESATVEAQLFRVISVGEKDGITFDVTATQYEPAKYAAIDDGAAFTPRPTVGNTFTTQLPPTNVTCSQYVVIDQGIAKTNLTIAWAAAANATSYRVQWQKDNGVWVDAGTTGQCSLDVANVYSGNYTARVSATNGMGITSVYALSSLTSITGKTGAPPIVASLTASTNQPFAIQLNWTFPTGAGDTAYTEIWQSTSNSFSTATQLGCYSYPTNSAALLGLASGVSLFFWARLVDTSGNIGAWFPASTAAGVNGKSSSDATAILSYLTGQITGTQLAQSLLAPIQSIPTISSSVSSLSSSQAALSTSVSSSVSSLSSSSASLSSSVSTLNGNAATLSSSISSTTSSLNSEISNRAAAISAEASARASADTVLSTSISTLTVSVSSANAAITSEQTARANGDSALATQISSLSSSVSTNTAAITSEQAARASGDSANATAISTLSTAVSTANASTSAAISAEQTARTSGDSANASAISTLSTSFSTALSTTNANVTAETTARTTGDAANASSISSLQSQVGNTVSITANVSGNSATGYPSGYTAKVFNSVTGTQIASSARSWNVVSVSSANAFTLVGQYDVFSSAANAATMATALGNIAAGTTVIVWTRDEPQTNVSAAMQSALVACGATNAALNAIQYRGAYLLVGVAGSGEGKGYERLAGTVGSDPNAWFSATFSLVNGALVGSANGLGAVLNSAAIQSEASTRATADTALASTISTLSTATSTSLSTAAANLATEQTARTSGDSALASSISSLSTSFSTGLSTANAAISSESSSRASGDSANAAAISALSTSFSTGLSTTNANVTAESTARATGDSSLASSITGLSTSISSSLSTANANITAEQSARATGDSQNASSITALSTSMSSSLSTANAALSTETSARSSGDSANAASISSLSTSVSTGLSTANASIASEASTRSAADANLASQISQLQAVTFVPMAGDSSGDAAGYAGATTVYAGVYSEQSARTDADLALATTISTLSTSFTNAQAANAAQITQEAQTRASADAANAALTSTVQSQTNQNAAAVQTVSQSLTSLSGQLSASYTIKTQVTANGQTYIAGIGVGVNASGGTVQSSVLVSASQFSVIDPNGTAVTSPFTITGGQVYMNSALIGNAAITNAMIGQTIQATAMGANGQPLWVLDKGGGLTLNGPNGGSGYLNLNSSTLTVYDNNGTLRVRLGLW